MSDAAICVLSIDVLHDDARTIELCRRLADAALPVTWTLASAPSDELAEAIRGQAGSEVALRADGWASEPSDRRTFLQSLTVGLTQLHAAGFSPTTIALSAGSLAAHDDLLVKHQIRAARVTERRVSSTARRAPKLAAKSALNCLSTLRWGLWEALVSAEFNQAGFSAAWRTVDRVCDRGGVALIAATSDALVADTKIASLFVGQLTSRRQTALRLTTLAAIVAESQAVRPASARSILRPAA